MRENGIRRYFRCPKKETTPYLWLLTSVVVIASCAGTPSVSPAEPVDSNETEIVQSNAAAATAAETETATEEAPKADASRAAGQTSSLEERIRNLSAQSAELAADNRYLRSQIAALESDLGSVRTENSVLKSLVDDILLAQGVLRPSAPAQRTRQTQPQTQPQTQSEPIARPVPVEEPQVAEPAPQPPRPVAEPNEPATPPTTIGPVATTAPQESVEPEPIAEPPAETVPAAEGAASQARRAAPARTEELETSRATRDTNLRFDRDESTGTVQYVDSRIVYDAPATAYLSVQTATAKQPMIHLHLRITARSGEEVIRLQSGRVGGGNDTVRLDASNSSTVRTEAREVTVEEVVAPLTTNLYRAVVDAIRLGGSVSVDGIRGSKEWELSAVERAAMTNMLYAYQDLGGRLP